MLTRKYLSIAVLAVIGAGSMPLANAASDAEVEALKQEVADLKQAVQELKAQQVTVQQQVAAVETTTAAPAPVTPPARTKDGWAILPDGKTSARVYGFVRADMIHDFNAAPPQVFSDLDKQPLSSSNSIRNRTQFTVKTTRIGVDLKTPTDYGDVTAKVEGDFWGDAADGSGNGFRFRHAYLTWNNLLVGHTWSPFISLESLPETVDFNTPVGGALRRKPQVRYTFNLDKSDTLAVAAEDSSSSYSVPALTAKFEHKLDDNKGLFNLRAMAQQKRGVVDATANKVEDKFGYGVAAGGLLNLTSSDKIMGEYFHVKGDGSFVYGGGAGYQIVDNAKANLHEILFDSLNSAIIGYTHVFSPKYRSTAALSWIGFDDKTRYAALNPTSNKELKQASINLFYNPVPSLTFGSEYTYGKREVYNGQTGIQSRIDLMARYNF